MSRRMEKIDGKWEENDGPQSPPTLDETIRSHECYPDRNVDMTCGKHACGLINRHQMKCRRRNHRFDLTFLDTLYLKY